MKKNNNNGDKYPTYHIIAGGLAIIVVGLIVYVFTSSINRTDTKDISQDIKLEALAQNQILLQASIATITTNVDRLLNRYMK